MSAYWSCRGGNVVRDVLPCRGVNKTVIAGGKGAENFALHTCGGGE